MKFAHLADCHIGGWTEEKLKELTIKSFQKAISICLEENVDFVLIAGDLFNTAIPQIELIKQTTEELKKLHNHNIPVYIVPGSHDFSPSGKTILSVLEKAGLITNVYNQEENDLKFTIDKKTNAKITGMLGLRSSLEFFKYQTINKEELEREQGFKIFILHSGIKEFMPISLPFIALPFDVIPKNFNYYAAGHVHYIFTKEIAKNSIIAYPGPLFPNNFQELEELEHGGFYIVDKTLNIQRKEIKLKDVIKIKLNANNKPPHEIENELKEIKNVKDKIVLIRIDGTLKEGNPSDINFNLNNLEEAYITIKNTSKLFSKEYEDIKIEANVENIEQKIVEDNLASIKEINFTQEDIISLLNIMNKEKEDGETVSDFEDRLVKDIKNELKLGVLFKNEN
ncbi:DNA repair exonuclease [Candidatus Woesearchaeota archaeon]|nr:DNA repair exonuclease [Candidatus Woesearchaeota archaeon]